ncbi:hypothetical protein FH972_017477 [Carpinus fangiana]|uniref:Uncharacterized protein n=1 Tax=Carpinus fangiana TaxID=176857 RepID=A0A5N6RM06_9ROSI|nr:hypothetical protein FH972_017477 [Carpinus fangiana]
MSKPHRNSNTKQPHLNSNTQTKVLPTKDWNVRRSVMHRCRSLEADLRCADVEASKVLATSRVSAKVTGLAAKVGDMRRKCPPLAVGHSLLYKFALLD